MTSEDDNIIYLSIYLSISQLFSVSRFRKHSRLHDPSRLPAHAYSADSAPIELAAQQSAKGVEVILMQSRMENLTSNRLKKPKKGARVVFGRKSRRQPRKGEMKPTRARRSKTSWRQPTRMRVKSDRRKQSWFGCLIQIRRMNQGPSGREGSRKGANTVTTTELRRAVQADKPTGRVEARGIEWVEECERGVKPKGTKAMI